jgi:pilus assembly protein CpaE
MLRAIIICRDEDLAARLECAVAETGHVVILRKFPDLPDSVALTRTVRAIAPQLVFLSTEFVDRAKELAHFIETSTPGMQVVAISRAPDPALLLDLMRAGIREFLSYPFAHNDVYEALIRINELLARHPLVLKTTDKVFSFLPSKAGVGASTLAVNTAIALARLPNISVALSDFDLNSGMLRFMLKLDTAYSVTDAVEHAFEMDETLWQQLVSHAGELDVLHAGKLNPNLRITGEQVRYLMEFLRRNYDALLFDLSGNLERYSLEIMQESKRILLVCTPEIPSLHLAREKLAFLQSLGLGDRITVVLNRTPKRPVITTEEIQDLLCSPVYATFPNDYKGVHDALTEGTCINPSSDLGQRFTAFANRLVDRPMPEAQPQPSKSRFSDLLGYLPNRMAPAQK